MRAGWTCTARVVSGDSPADLAAAYFKAWESNDIERVRPLLAENVDFADVLGTTQGVDGTLSGPGRMFAVTDHVEVIRRWIDGPDVLTWFELRTATAGPMAIVNWSHVEAGRITRIRVSFDPRPMLGWAPAWCSTKVQHPPRRLVVVIHPRRPANLRL
jgi:hypothetical protein